MFFFLYFVTCCFLLKKASWWCPGKVSTRSHESPLQPSKAKSSRWRLGAVTTFMPLGFCHKFAMRSPPPWRCTVFATSQPDKNPKICLIKCVGAETTKTKHSQSFGLNLIAACLLYMSLEATGRLTVEPGLDVNMFVWVMISEATKDVSLDLRERPEMGAPSGI